jgi:uncharacterized membrane protein
MNVKRKINVFEKLLLLIGIGIAVVGFYLLNRVFATQDRLFDGTMLIGVLLWLLLIFVMILCAIAENQREELNVIIAEHIKETRLLREISKEHLEEIRLLRDEVGSKKRKK